MPPDSSRGQARAAEERPTSAKCSRAICNRSFFDAAFSVGTDPIRVRMAAIIAGGALAGLGGAVLSLQEIGTFTDGMTSGRGFIALAAIIVGRWMPFRVMLGYLLFGAASAVALNIQGWGLPVSSYIIQMTPYLIALAVLCGVGRAARMPAAIGKPFIQG